VPTQQQASAASDHVLGNPGLSREYDERLDELWQYREKMDADDLPRWRRNLRELERALAPAAARLGLDVPAQFEPWPEDEPGALTTPTPHGYLVLMSTGLTKLAVLSARLYSVLVIGTPEAATTAQQVTVEAVQLLLDGEDLGPLASSLALPAPATEQAAVMASAALHFVAAHEYAHCSLGHLEVLAAKPVLDPAEPFGLATQELHSQLRERDADRLGLRLLQGMFPQRAGATADPLEPPLALGPVVLFSHLAFHQTVHFEWGAFHIGADHPPADLRLFALVTALEQTGTPLVRECVRRYLDEWHHPMQEHTRSMAREG
jgi:hypothetical protein